MAIRYLNIETQLAIVAPGRGECTRWNTVHTAVHREHKRPC